MLLLLIATQQGATQRKEIKKISLVKQLSLSFSDLNTRDSTPLTSGPDLTEGEREACKTLIEHGKSLSNNERAGRAKEASEDSIL